MAQRGVQLDGEVFTCSICLDLLRDPVTTSCGHSYCMSCIKAHWDGEAVKGTYSCPQCRQAFAPRPVLRKNTILAVLVEQLKETGLPSAPAYHCYAGPEDDSVSAAAQRTKKQKELEVSLQNIQRRIQDREEEVKLLQQEVQNISRSADKTVEDSEKMFSEMIRLLEKRSSEVKRQVRSQQDSEVSRVRELQEKLQQEIAELRRRDAELKELSHTEDHNQFLHSFSSLSALSLSTSSIQARPLRCFEAVTAAVAALRDKLQDVLRETWTDASMTQTEVDVLLSGPNSEPTTRAEFLRYSCEITLDPNTAYTYLVLSDGNRKATFVPKPQSYPRHPDRFTGWHQVLSRESLTGRCYWEVHWGEGGVDVAVSYKNISRAGWSKVSGFGRNDKSWSLECFNNKYTFLYNDVKIPVSGPVSSRLGVYLDHRAGVLSFYSVSATMTLLHRVQTTFSQPLHAGLYLFKAYGARAEFCKLK